MNVWTSTSKYGPNSDRPHYVKVKVTAAGETEWFDIRTGTSVFKGQDESTLKAAAEARLNTEKEAKLTAEEEALRKDLLGKKRSDLKKYAKHKKIDEGLIQSADDEDDPRRALVELIFNEGGAAARRKAEEEAAAAAKLQAEQALRKELVAKKRAELKTYAKEKDISEGQIQEADDDDEDPKGTLIELIIRHWASSAPSTQITPSTSHMGGYNAVFMLLTQYFFFSLRFGEEWLLEFVKKLQKELEKQGHTVFLCLANAGDNFGEFITTALYQCTKMVSFLTNDPPYGARGCGGPVTTYFELKYFEDHQKPIIPLKMEPGAYPPTERLASMGEKEIAGVALLTKAFPSTLGFIDATDLDVARIAKKIIGS